MDAKSIGHEFVRQYYELLHSDPGQLHRFYLENSTYIHANENQAEPPVIGQQAIYECINRLNFTDCRTRIRQVDAQESIQKSYVVQVVGELSNAGRPMRPFVQTFILAQSSENKFFVNNDMFRYQDHIVAPDSNDAVITVPEVVSTVPAVDPIVSNQVDNYFSKSPETHAHINGDVTIIDAPEPADVSPVVEEPVHQPEPAQPQLISEPEPEPVRSEPSPEIKQQEAKPFSWASVASSSSSSGQAATKKTPAPAPSAIVRAPEQVKPTPPPTVASQQQVNHKPQRRANGTANGSSAPASNTRSGASSRANGSSIPDNQQIFVGGLQANMTEEDIKGAFSEFGAAIDIRMTQKQFCFVAFASSDIVDSILASAKEPGFFIRSQRLNVEEKKEKASAGRVQNNRQNASGASGNRGARVGGGNFSRGAASAGSRPGRDSGAGHRR